jgi:hypothetical protein
VRRRGEFQKVMKQKSDPPDAILQDLTPTALSVSLRTTEREPSRIITTPRAA